MKYRTFTILLVLLFLFSLVSNVILDPSDCGSIQSDDIAENSQNRLLSYTGHDPIVITDNSNFSSTGWLGGGVEGNPYYIEGLSFDNDSVCIYIEDTTAHFEIRNCEITSSDMSSNPGIVLQNVTFGSVLGSTVDSHSDGIFLDQSKNCTLNNNTITTNFDNGLHLNSSHNCTLTNNTVSSNHDNGFYLYDSKDCVLYNNTAFDNLIDGFNLYIAYRSILINNTARNNSDVGFYLEYSSWSTLTNNSAIINHDCGVRLDHSSLCLVDNNFAFNNTWYGIDVYSSSRCNLTNNLVLAQRGYGIHIHSYAWQCILINNTANSNEYAGFWFNEADNCEAYNNTGKYNSWSGLVVNNCDGVIVSDNNMEFNQKHGIALEWAKWTKITGNRLLTNSRDGLFVRLGSEENEAYLNQLGYNFENNGQDDGLDNDWDNGTHGNYWSDYSGEGVYSVPGDANSVDNYPYLFNDNRTYISQPDDVEYDEFSTGNKIIWNPISIQPENYTVFQDGLTIASGLWNTSSEYIVVSIDDLSLGTFNFTVIVKDMIGGFAIDTVIVTVVDGTSPLLDSPADVSYIRGQTGNLITWTPVDSHPVNYNISRNGTVIQSGLWNSSSEVISISVDSLPVGVYIYNISVVDIGNNFAHDEVIVRVSEQTITTSTVNTTTTGPSEPAGEAQDIMMLSLMLGIASLGVIIIVYIAIRRNN